MTRYRLASVLLAVLGCNDSAMPRLEEEQDDPLAALEGIPWKELSAEDKGVIMRFKVLPRMGDVLAEIDPERFDSITCRTCHGQNAQQVAFKMPGNIKALDWNNLPHTPLADAMGTRVVPEMAALLGLTPFDPGTGEGEFGCANCHRVVE